MTYVAWSSPRSGQRWRARIPATWFLPDPMARPGARFLRRARTSFVTVEDAVYWVEDDRDPARLRAAWDFAASAAGHMGLVTTTAPPQVPTHDDLAIRSIASSEARLDDLPAAGADPE
jgi:hypothetical protein